MTTEKANIEKEILEYPGVCDPGHLHHEFYDGRHGMRLDLGSIHTSSQLYGKLITGQANDLSNIYENGIPKVLISAAERGNQIVHDIADELQDGVIAMTAEKDNRGRALLANFAGRALLRRLRPELILVIADVGTTGKSVRPLVEQLHRNSGLDKSSKQKQQNNVKVDAYFCWQRQARLKNLERSLRNYHKVSYNSYIVHPLKIFQNDQACKDDPEGFCANNVELIPYGQ